MGCGVWGVGNRSGLPEKQRLIKGSVFGTTATFRCRACFFNHGMFLRGAGMLMCLNPSYGVCLQDSALMLLLRQFIFHLSMQLIIFTVLM